MSTRLLIAAVTGPFLDPTTYGAACDMRGVYDAVVVGGSLSTVVSATAAFTADDTGKTFTLASTAGAVTTGTLTYVDATHATMSAAAGGAMTGARLIFGTDDRAAWQDALDAALPGQCVDCADPSYRSLVGGGGLAVPMGVHLGLPERGPFDAYTNPAMNTWGPTLGIIEDSTNPFITLDWNSGLGDLIIYAINQATPTASAPIARGPIVRMLADVGGCRIGSPYMPNAYQGIWIRGGRHHVIRPHIGALRHGLVLDGVRDTVDIDRVTCHPYWRVCEGMAYTPTAGSFDEYAQDNGRAVVLYSADGVKIGTIFSFGLYSGLLSIDSPTVSPPANSYGMIGMIDADNCVVGIDAWETNSPGILIGQALLGANGTGVGTAGSSGVATHTGGSTAPKVVVKSWSHRGTWANGASSVGAGTTLIVPSTNPG